MCNVLILHFFLALFSADIEAKAIIGTIPNYSMIARDSAHIKDLNVNEVALVWDNFQKDYKGSRGFMPRPEGYSQIICDNPWVYNTGLEIPPVKLYILSANDREYYIETIAPLR